MTVIATVGLSLARELLAVVEARRDTAYHWQDHDDECREQDLAPLGCDCPIEVQDLLDSLVDELRHLVWLADLDPRRSGR